MRRVELMCVARNGLQVMRLLAALALFAAVSAGNARAEIFSVCAVMPTSDGFVALRDRPSRQGKLLARMHPGDMAVIEVKNNDYVRSGKWLSIEFHRLDKKSPKKEKFDFVAKGWAFDDYINECG